MNATAVTVFIAIYIATVLVVWNVAKAYVSGKRLTEEEGQSKTPDNPDVKDTESDDDIWKLTWCDVSKRLPAPGRLVIVAFMPEGDKPQRCIFTKIDRNGKWAVKTAGEVLAWAPYPQYRKKR